MKNVFHLEFRDMLRWKVSIARSDLLRVRWLLLFQCTFIIDFISFKTAQFKNYLSYIILFFLWSFYQVYGSGEFWQVSCGSFQILVFCFVTFKGVLILIGGQCPTTIPAAGEKLVASFFSFTTIACRQSKKLSCKKELNIQVEEKITKKKIKWIKLNNLL